MGAHASMIGRRCEFGCRCCWTSASPGPARDAARRTAKRRERATWRRELDVA